MHLAEMRDTIVVVFLFKKINCCCFFILKNIYDVYKFSWQSSQNKSLVDNVKIPYDILLTMLLECDVSVIYFISIFVFAYIFLFVFFFSNKNSRWGDGASVQNRKNIQTQKIFTNVYLYLHLSKCISRI